MGDYTDILFARPSFLEGIARVLDIGGTLQEYNRSLTSEQADAVALGADVAAIGQDMYVAMGIVADENGIEIVDEAD
jgi:hypothetical protein